VIKAVVFDVDGVLIDSEPVWERVRRNFVATRGGRWPDDAQDRMMGMSTAEWSAYMSEDFGLRLAPQGVAELVIAEMTAAYRAHLPLLPGAVDAVRALSARWRLAVASSAPKTLIEAVLDASGLRWAFDAAVSSEEVTRGKPAPDVYLEATARLGIPPEACAAVEDSSNGLRAAAAAGMAVIAVPRPEYPPAADALQRARVVLDSLTELTSETIAALLYPGGTTPRLRYRVTLASALLRSPMTVQPGREGEAAGGARTVTKSRVQPVRYWSAGRCWPGTPVVKGPPGERARSNWTHSGLMSSSMATAAPAPASA
jgi:HAD superfamily hydrolase (TIGR01509 family)